jgi:fatty acid desaturase
MWTLLLARSPKFFLSVYLPGYAAGLAFCYVHGYFEHAYGTKSNYGHLYNVPFFNDGYHVEHHMKPHVHWTRLPKVVVDQAERSRWPAILRWIESLSLLR